jgi:general secretion pathway protein D
VQANLAELPTLVSDRASNSLIAVATPAEHQRLESLIERLDVRQAQVMLEVLMVSLSDDQSLDLGVEIDRLIDGPDNSIGRLSSLFGLGANAAAQAVGAAGAGLTGVVLTPGEFSVVVRALEAINNGRSVSTPRVLVENNSAATIDAVLEAPFLSTNASDTVATTSFGGSESAGTQVQVTPQIAEGGHVRLEYSVSLSAFVGDSASPSLPPPRQQTSVASVATIPNGYTVAVGGIEVNTDGDAETRVPGLGSIPLVGNLFKNRSKSDSRARFYVFIRAEVLRSPTFADLRFLSDQQAEAAGVDDGWPEVTPRLIR